MSNLTLSFVRPFVGACLFAGLAITGCGGNDLVSGGGAGVDRSRAGLSGTAGQSSPLVPKGIKGTYGANCKVHKNESWALTFDAPITTPPALEVALNDSILAGCPLKLTSITVQEGTNTALKDYPVASPFNLTRTYQTVAAQINVPPPPSSTLSFFANARILNLDSPPTPAQTDTYYQNFVIDVIWSNDKSDCDLNAPPATYATVKATATGSAVPTPGYVINWDSLALKVDANRVVQPSSSGSVIVQLPAGGQAGEKYKLFTTVGTPDCCGMNSFAEIDAFYKGSGTEQNMPAAGGSLTIPWNDFALSGQTLSSGSKLYRHIVVKHTDGGGVYAYQLFQIAFTGPTP